MKTIKIIAGISLIMLLGFAATIHASTILWQIGDNNSSADEFSTNGEFQDTFTYDFGEVSKDDSQMAYTLETPGYFYTRKYETDYRTIDTFTTEVLKIQFTLVDAYDELILNYSRAGAELSEIYLNEEFVSSQHGPGENIWSYYSVSLFDVAAGDNEISFLYAGEGSFNGRVLDNGFFLDFMQLENGKVAAPVPEPATMLLLGFGLIGLAGIGRRKFKK